MVPPPRRARLRRRHLRGGQHGLRPVPPAQLPGGALRRRRPQPPAGLPTHPRDRSDPRADPRPAGHPRGPDPLPPPRPEVLLLRGQVYRDGQNWSAKHLRWLRNLALPLDEDRKTLDFLLDELEQRQTSLGLLDQRIERRAQLPDIEEAVRCMRAFRGIDTLTAISVVAELGDPRRFRSARQVAAYCGIVPSEHSSGMKVKRGAITRAGNARLRRLLVETIQHYARPFPKNSAVLARRARAPQRAQSIAATAERRLRARYRCLAARKHTNVAKTAVARELVGFLWTALLPVEA